MKIVSIVLIVVLLGGCKTLNTDSSPKYATDKIQLQLVKTMKPERIQAGFQSLGIEHLCTLDKANNLNVFAFDTKQYTLEKMLTFMGNEVGVIKAEKTLGCKN